MRAESILKVFLKLVVLVYISIFFNHYSVKAQPLAQIHVTGSNVMFIYSTLNHYNTGITLTGRTTVRVRYRNAVNPDWELKLRALDDKIAFDGAGSDIPLNNLVLTVLAPSATPVSPFSPTTSYQTIASGGGGGEVDPAEFTVTISYTLPAMINRVEGLYFVALDFILVEDGHNP